MCTLGLNTPTLLNIVHLVSTLLSLLLNIVLSFIILEDTKLTKFRKHSSLIFVYIFISVCMFQTQYIDARYPFEQFLSLFEALNPIHQIW